MKPADFEKARAERAGEILRRRAESLRCSCGNGPNHAPDCSYERALEDIWDQAGEEIFEEAEARRVARNDAARRRGIPS